MTQATALDPSALAYLDELAADIAAHGGFGERDPAVVIAEAHERRQAFILEMHSGTTMRAKIARAVLSGEVYGACIASSTREKVLAQCDDMVRADAVDQIRSNWGI